jgi:hypothetical protein
MIETKRLSMLRHFLSNNRADLAARCAAKVAKRPSRHASPEQLETGIPLFLEQLIHTLEAEHEGKVAVGVRISGPPGGDRAALSEMGVAAAIHGKALLVLGYTVDQVVHDYGDLCQSISDLACERDAPFSIEEYRTLNRCLDNAIADAVAEFCAVRDAEIHSRQASEGNQRLGFLMHELRNALSVAPCRRRHRRPAHAEPRGDGALDRAVTGGGQIGERRDGRPRGVPARRPAAGSA